MNQVNSVVQNRDLDDQVVEVLGIELVLAAFERVALTVVLLLIVGFVCFVYKR